MCQQIHELGARWGLFRSLQLPVLSDSLILDIWGMDIHQGAQPLQHNAKAHPLGCYGATRSQASRTAEQRVKGNGRLWGEIWIVDVLANSTWAEVCWQMKLKLRIGNDDLELLLNRAEVDARDRIPRPNQHDHVHVDLQRILLQNGTRSRPRTRSSTPRRQTMRNTVIQAMQTEVRVIDLDAIHIEQKSLHGAHILQVSLEDVAKEKQLCPDHWPHDARLCDERALASTRPRYCFSIYCHRADLLRS